MVIGVFEFVLLLVLITTIGKVLTVRSGRPALREGVRPEDLERINETMGELHTRLAKLEEERDFYRALLESPGREKLSEPPGETGE